MTPEARRADELVGQYQWDIHQRTDRLFAGLMAFQWIAGIVFALWVSPLTWDGPVSRTHLHVWAAVIVGGVICLPPALLALARPGFASTRYTVAVAQMLMGALLIHLTGGRIETHFHVFGSLAFLAFYRDWRVLVPATVVVALDHLLRGIFWPQSVYGVLVASQWRWLEHAAWVLFEDAFLVVSCRRSFAEMRQTAERTAALEQEIRTRRQAENAASLTAAVGLALTRGTELPAMLNQCAEALVQHLDGGFARIWTLDESGEVLHLAAGAGLCTAFDAGHSHLPIGRSAIGAIACTRQPLVTHAADVDLPIGDPAWIGPERLAVVAGYPLLLDSKLVGVMAIFAPHEFPASSQDALAAVADAVALGIERKRAERELERSHQQAEAATRAKSDFLASMSHELRTPLNAIILYSELLQEEARDQEHGTSIPDLQRIQSAGNHLLDLINGILDLSKIEAGKMTLSLERFSICRMVDDLLDTMNPLALKNDNTLTVVCAENMGTMYGDSMKTRQILLNLLGNATKFTRQGTITLDVRTRAAAGAREVVFTVTDTGVGMTPDQSAKIFDAFTQADVTTTRKYGGTGLGLAIVSRFCQMMGGRVAVDSQPGVGSRFTVHLPLEAVDIAEAGEIVAAGAA
jgi:two-component system sensor histidine kinase/response regulator